MPPLPKDISYQKLYEPEQNIWFLNWILKQRGCDPYLNQNILSMPFTVERGYFNNGLLKYLIFLKNDITSLRRSFFGNGQLRYEGNFRDGKSHGLFRGWYHNGQQRWEEHWQNGQLHGLSRDWNINGTLGYAVNWIFGRPKHP